MPTWTMQAADALAPSRLPTTDQGHRHSVPSPQSHVTAESPNPDKTSHAAASPLLRGALAGALDARCTGRELPELRRRDPADRNHLPDHGEWIADCWRHLSERSMAKLYETSDNATVAAI